MKTVLIIPVFERADYLLKTLESVWPWLTDDVHVILADDGSTDPQVQKICNAFMRRRLNRNRYWQFHNSGIAFNLLRSIEQCREYDTIITLDSDFIVKPDFFTTLKKLLADHGNQNTIITGFNASSHPITDQHEGYAVKGTIGGGNLCFTWAAYEKHIRRSLVDSLWDWRMCESVQKASGWFICATPSICQHIGTESTMGHKSSDKAEDY